MKVASVGGHEAPGVKASVFFNPDNPDDIFRLYLGEGEQPGDLDMEPSPEGYFEGRLLAILNIGCSAGLAISSGADPELLDRLLPPTTNAAIPGILRLTGECAVELFRYKDGGPSVIAVNSTIAESVSMPEREPA